MGRHTPEASATRRKIRRTRLAAEDDGTHGIYRDCSSGIAAGAAKIRRERQLAQAGIHCGREGFHAAESSAARRRLARGFYGQIVRQRVASEVESADQVL